MSNLSLTNERQDQLSTKQKVGMVLFILGLMALLWLNSSSQDKTVWAYVMFGIQGSGLFLLFWHSDGSRRFNPTAISTFTRVGNFLGLSGFLTFTLGWFISAEVYWIWISLVLWMLAIATTTIGLYAKKPAGIKNNGVFFSTLSARGWIAWVLGIVLTIFYIQLYWSKEPFTALVAGLDPLSELFRGKPADKWFLYGTLYTFVILFLGIKFIIKYRHNRYHLIRTIVVIFSQLIMAYFIPNILEALQYNSATIQVNGEMSYQGYYSGNPVNSYPLNYSAFDPGTIEAQLNTVYQPVGMAYLFWGILLFVVGTPLLTYFYGKRWYCSWICGCGGLAETAGDSFRHLSDKSTKAWKIERWLIHGVMVFVIVMTLAVMYSYLSGNDFTLAWFTLNKTAWWMIASIALIVWGVFIWKMVQKYPQHTFLKVGLGLTLILFSVLLIAYVSGSNHAFAIKSSSLKKGYGFLIGACFSGVIGVGFYPILGNRVWCRFGCPMAGYMGIFQRFKSKFRITTNGGQCISCGNCSVYCEQGIDVRAYAQKGENIVRASCVGCGICAAVCPRGVLKLENGDETHRFENNHDLINSIRK